MFQTPLPLILRGPQIQQQLPELVAWGLHLVGRVPLYWDPAEYLEVQAVP